MMDPTPNTPTLLPIKQRMQAQQIGMLIPLYNENTIVGALSLGDKNNNTPFFTQEVEASTLVASTVAKQLYAAQEKST